MKVCAERGWFGGRCRHSCRSRGSGNRELRPRELASPLRGDERKMILGIFPAAVGEPPTGSLVCSLAAPGYLELFSGSSGIAPRLASFGTQTPLPSEIAFMQSWWRRK